MKGFPSNTDAKIQTNHLRQTDEIFRIGKYEDKIIFDKLLGLHLGGSPLNEDAKT